ncbi:ABC transporter substrate-binding protein [Thalassolituus hydrocarboniclasticus]|uniref:ABC transporter substrate-binding protein n=1 Tax=Thalassolituus hydrocarboniclasticus TaxID=2742796 RepID=A0ABY6AA43_9GAMM|nr:ABC transporter substrate-binding protein [Thalassolituus hydrocarboniclasticus]UXD87567.1 ABC transporter substrate-binding protein [Thalassolituus hydrocarboniclasticus]
MKYALQPVLLIVCLLLGLTAQAAEDAPRATVEATAKAMTDRLISDRELVRTQENYVEQLVDELLLPVVDHVYMAKRVLGKYWKRASMEQQKTFIIAFKEKVIRTYAGAFRAFDGETITFEDSRLNEQGNQAIVKSQIQRAGAAPIRVDYKLYLQQNQWQVYDVIIEGVSLTKSFRDQVSLSIEQDGLAQAISKLADEYKSASPTVKLGARAWGPYLGNNLPGFGLAADIVTTAFARAGYQVELTFVPPLKIEEHISSGQLQGEIAAWQPQQPTEQQLYSDPYLQNTLVFIKRDNDPFDYQSPAQLQTSLADKSYRLGVFNDVHYGREFNRVAPLFQLQKMDYCSQLFREVAGKSIDLALVDAWMADIELSSKEHIASHLQRVSTPLASRDLRVSIARATEGADALLKAFNTGLKRIKADGTYQSLLKKHNYPQ